MTEEIGRYCELNGLTEVQELEAGMDFRKPEYRREVFLRFYQFHLKHRSHPGGVYYLMPYLAEAHGWDIEQKLWFAYINGHTQHPPTSLIIMRRFPFLPHNQKQMNVLTTWFNDYWDKLSWDMDRRYQKKMFPDGVEEYRSKLIKGTQLDLFNGLNFAALWSLVRNDFLSFGRLSTFSYLEYLRIMGLDFDCDDLFLEDMSGSKSHRNGLAKVLGRDDLDWHGDNEVKYTPAQITWLKTEAASLLRETKQRLGGTGYHRDISYFTLESAFCTFKSWFRTNRRYPNVYNDMLYHRLRETERKWPQEDLSVFWEARADTLPTHLLLETTGAAAPTRLEPKLQNHFRLTGQIVNMEKEWPCFQNELSVELSSAASGP